MDNLQLLKNELERYKECNLRAEVSERLTKYSEELMEALTAKNKHVTMSVFESKKMLKDTVENGYD